MHTRMHLFLKEQIRDIFNRFALCFNIHLTFYSLNMQKMAASFPERSLYYCERIQKELGLLPRCLQQDEKMCALARERGSLISYNCHAGLHEVIIPVKIDGKIVGFIMIGQFKTRNKIPFSITKIIVNP